MFSDVGSEVRLVDIRGIVGQHCLISEHSRVRIEFIVTFSNVSHIS